MPVLSSDPATAEPIGVGTAANGGDVFDLTVGAGPFAAPMDISLAIYSPDLDAFDIFYLMPDRQVKRMSEALQEESEQDRQQQRSRGDGGETDSHRIQRKYSRLVLWKTGVTSVSEDVLSAPVADIPPGVYTLILTATLPDGSGNEDSFYRWTTQLVVPKHSGGRHDD